MKDFLVNRDQTGREIVFYPETGKKYYVEYLGNGRMADWGSFNPSTGKIENKKGAGKNSGSIKEDESLITKENGFKNIVVGKGSAYSKIEEMHQKYKQKYKQ